jgi:hypothetical protein
VRRAVVDRAENSRKEKGRGIRGSLLLCRGNILSTLVTEGSVPGNLGVAMWAGFQSEAFGPNVLMHQFGEFSVAE